jgi:putative phosphoesterase
MSNSKEATASGSEGFCLNRASNQKAGIISDTHGLARPELLHVLQGVDLIIHAGDVGSVAVLDALREIAPVFAVRGNMDRSSSGLKLPQTELVEMGQISIYVLHDLSRLDLDPTAVGVQAVISGHSHKPSSFLRNGVLYLNPGSAGPKRFRLPVSMGYLFVCGSDLVPQLINLEPHGEQRSQIT